jgi:hypothetical protein
MSEDEDTMLISTQITEKCIIKIQAFGWLQVSVPKRGQTKIWNFEFLSFVIQCVMFVPTTEIPIRCRRDYHNYNILLLSSVVCRWENPITEGEVVKIENY